VRKRPPAQSLCTNVSDKACLDLLVATSSEEQFLA
jgi:hypothetical protein